MGSYVISEMGDSARHAGPKARADVAEILSDEGWNVKYVFRAAGGGLPNKISAIPRHISSWAKIGKELRGGDNLLIQFPLDMYPQVSLSCLPTLRGMKRRGIRIYYLIHDLDSLRGYKDNVERGFLSLADGIVAHNDSMRAYLLRSGYCANVVSLGIFDYLPGGSRTTDIPRNGIDIAGNMSPEKAGYVYRLHELDTELNIHLYGPNFDRDSFENKWYRGEFSPEDLGNELRGKFGLVWDGDSLDACSGEYGNYLRYNNPHKLSMYLAFGEPVIIWGQAAEAGFVREHGVGLAVASLRDAFDEVASMSENQYAEYQNNAANLSGMIRTGFFTKRAVERMFAEQQRAAKRN